mmetsp:Transcript_34321/g.105153  ORF Transcript_34321/g.105153 Transcript_34321/m.105153 type:complete len:244 (-) Transcript_34321:593-1324(-)
MPPIIGPAVRCARPPAGCCSPSEGKLCEERDCEGDMPYRPRGDVCCCACCGDESCACCGVCGCGGPSALPCWLSCCAGGEEPAEAACWWSCAAGGDVPAACAVAWACSWLRARQDPWQDPCGDPITELPGEDGVVVRLRPNPPMFACPLMPPMPPAPEPHMAWPGHDPPWPHPPPPSRPPPSPRPRRRRRARRRPCLLAQGSRPRHRPRRRRRPWRRGEPRRGSRGGGRAGTAPLRPGGTPRR